MSKQIAFLSAVRWTTVATKESDKQIAGNLLPEMWARNGQRMQ